MHFAAFTRLGFTVPRRDVVVRGLASLEAAGVDGDVGEGTVEEDVGEAVTAASSLFTPMHA
ncbi:hypothetical protein [Actinomadura atramentaria]|uniref:hypothetical protein n=1 Tax=Actinomadura atramentaria TaxID=1990 RepID=UPI00038083B1|nr:hypothetical protein [Actinomadura atramentaria]